MMLPEETVPTTMNRQKTQLASHLEKRMAAYASAGAAKGILTRGATVGAAGIAVLALVPAAAARIIYTPAHESLVGLTLDLNHDGKGDIQFNQNVDATTSVGMESIWVGPPSSSVQRLNKAVATPKNLHAVALRAGSRIGPNRQFETHGVIYGDVVYRNPPHTVWFGQWGNGGKGLKNRYLGIKFTINGQFHYGWARISVTVSGNQSTSLLTGYAYETVPNKPIIAGKTKGPNSSEEQTTLGQLARGSARP
jgi:hypothetical protein